MTLSHLSSLQSNVNVLDLSLTIHRLLLNEPFDPS